MREGQGWRALPATLIVGTAIACVASFMEIGVELAHATPRWDLLLSVGCAVSSRLLTGHGLFVLASRHVGATRRCLQAAAAGWFLLALWVVARLLLVLSLDVFDPWFERLHAISYWLWWPSTIATTAALALDRRRGAAFAMFAINGGSLLLIPLGFWKATWVPRPFYLSRFLDIALPLATLVVLGCLAVAGLAEPERGRRGLNRIASGLWIAVIASIQSSLAVLIASSEDAYRHREMLRMCGIGGAAFAASAMVWCTWGALDAARGLERERRWLAIAAGAMAWCAGIATAQALYLYRSDYRGGQHFETVLGALTFFAPLVFIVGLFTLITALQNLAHEQGDTDVYFLLFRRRLSICMLALFAAVIGAWGLSTSGLGQGAPGVFVVLMLACKIPAFGMAAHVIRSTADVVAPDVPAARIVGLGETSLTPAEK